LNAPHPFIQLRAATTKSKRADVLPVRANLADLLRKAKGDASDGDRVVKVLPRIPTHRKYLAAAGIPWLDDAGRRANIHCLRHSYGTLLSKGGVSPREVMSLMRHTDLRLTMKVYTDPRIFDLAGAVEKLPITLGTSDEAQAAQATGTDDKPAQQDQQDGQQVANRVAIATLDRHSAAANDNAGSDRRQSQLRDLAGIGDKKPHPAGWGERAGDGIRTHDVSLGKAAFCH